MIEQYQRGTKKQKPRWAANLWKTVDDDTVDRIFTEALDQVARKDQDMLMAFMDGEELREDDLNQVCEQLGKACAGTPAMKDLLQQRNPLEVW